jgi:hypothetical protein
MNHELLMVMTAISRMSDPSRRDHPRNAALGPRAQRGRRRLLPVLRATTARRLQKGRTR